MTKTDKEDGFSGQVTYESLQSDLERCSGDIAKITERVKLAPGDDKKLKKLKATRLNIMQGLNIVCHPRTKQPYFCK